MADNRKPVPSGWCLDRQHKACVDFYLKQPYNRGCVCKCHAEEKEDVWMM